MKNAPRASIGGGRGRGREIEREKDNVEWYVCNTGSAALPHSAVTGVYSAHSSGTVRVTTQLRHHGRAPTHTHTLHAGKHTHTRDRVHVTPND